MRPFICTVIAATLLPACAAHEAPAPTAAAPPSAESNLNLGDFLLDWQQQHAVEIGQSLHDSWQEQMPTILPPITVDRGYDIHIEGSLDELDLRIKELLETPAEPHPERSP